MVNKILFLLSSSKGLCTLRYIALFFLLCFSGCCNKSPRWVFQTVDSCSYLTRSIQFSWRTSNLYTGITLEFLKGNFKTQGFLNVYCREIREDADYPSYAKVFLTYQEKSVSFYARLLEGGQRILLPQEITQELLYRFIAQESVTITLEPNYCETISPYLKERHYRELLLQRL